MRLDTHDTIILDTANGFGETLEALLDTEVVFYSGIISDQIFSHFRQLIEDIKKQSEKITISVVLRTGGDSVEAAERMVGVLRHHYDTVY